MVRSLAGLAAKNILYHIVKAHSSGLLKSYRAEKESFPPGIKRGGLKARTKGGVCGVGNPGRKSLLQGFLRKFQKNYFCNIFILGKTIKKSGNQDS